MGETRPSLEPPWLLLKDSIRPLAAQLLLSHRIGRCREGGAAGAGAGEALRLGKSVAEPRGICCLQREIGILRSSSRHWRTYFQHRLHQIACPLAALTCGRLFKTRLVSATARFDILVANPTSRLPYALLPTFLPPEAGFGVRHQGMILAGAGGVVEERAHCQRPPLTHLLTP